MTLISVKLSFLLLYLRIFRTNRYMRITTWFVMGLVIIYGTWAFFTNIFLCWPIQAVWDITLIWYTGNKCLDLYTVTVAYTSLNAGTDVLILLLPLPGLQRLQMPRGQKIGLILVFSLGVL